MINCNENENYNEKTDDINKTYIEKRGHREKDTKYSMSW